MRTMILALAVSCLTLSAATARASESDTNSGADSDTSFGLALTLGESMYFLNDSVYRGPFSVELVPSYGWPWFKVDFGLLTTLESIRIADTDVGKWNVTFRPGVRLTPTMLPLYARLAFPLQFQEDNIDFGMMMGVGADIPVSSLLGVVFELDTTLSDDLNWGNNGVPVDFRAGVSLAF